MKLDKSIQKIKTNSREEWLELRLKGIGGSDAGTLLGYNTYKSPYALWAEKTGNIQVEDISDKPSVRLGNDLEDYVAKRWCEITGKSVKKLNYTLVNPKFPFAHANIDREVVGENAGLECKTTSDWETIRTIRSGEVPAVWKLQCYHYMMVTGMQKWYLCALCFGDNVYEFTIDRDDAEISQLSALERDFWDLVVSNTPPSLDGSESTTKALKTILSECTPGTHTDLTAVGHALEAYRRCEARLDELDEERERWKEEIMMYMGSTERGTYGNYTVTFRNSYRKTFDKKEFERVNGPIGDEFYRESKARICMIRYKEN